MSDYKAIANSPLMFALCGLVIVFVIIQTFIFMRRAWKRGKEIGMDEGLMKKTITSSALFSIVPSIPILIILLMLMSALGNYFPWLRLSVIGSSSYEHTAALVTARTFGLSSYTDPGYNTSIFLGTMWAMSICIIYEPLLIVLGMKSLDKGMDRIKTNNPSLYKLMIEGIFIAMLGWFCAPYITLWTKSAAQIPALAALVAAFIAAQIFSWLAKRTKSNFLNEFSFPGGMLVGMLAAFIANMVIS